MAEKRIGVRPTAPKPAAKGTRVASKAKSSGSSKSKSKGKSPQAQANAANKAAEKRAIARENAAKKKSGKKYLEGAANLQVQADAIKQALQFEFKSALNSNLADLDMNLGQQLGMLKTDAATRGREFLKTASDTETATGATAEHGFTNLVRERQDSMSSLLEQGAGETDTMRAMLMSARNWSSNANEANRAHFDTMRSVNSGITDLNINTKTGLANAFSTSQGERDRLWEQYYQQRSGAFNQLGNVYGQQADFYAQAKEMGVKPKKGAEKAAEDAMKKAFKDSAFETGKDYVQEALPEWISDYQGQAQVDAKLSNTNLASAMTVDKAQKAEGATLRKWDAA